MRGSSVFVALGSDRADADAFVALRLVLRRVGHRPQRPREDAAVQDHLAPLGVFFLVPRLERLLEPGDPVRVYAGGAARRVVAPVAETALDDLAPEAAPVVHRAYAQARGRALALPHVHAARRRADLLGRGSVDRERERGDDRGVIQHPVLLVEQRAGEAGRAAAGELRGVL